MKKMWMILLLAAAVTGMGNAVYGAQIPIAKKGEAVSRIVIDADAPVAVHHAARELQNYFRLLTTARISIMNALPGGWQSSAVVLALTDSPLVEKIVTDEMKKKLAGTDGYAVTVLEPSPEFIDGTRRDRHQTFLLAFAVHADEALIEEQVADAQATELADAQPAAVEGLQDRTVALPLVLREVYGVDQAVYLLHCQHIGQPFAARR